MALSVIILQIVVLTCCAIPCIVSAVDVKWCHVPDDATDCHNLNKNLGAIKCVQASNIYRCMEMVKTGEADVLYVSDTELYPAGQVGLKPLLKVVHNNSAAYRYKAVAVVKANGKVKKLADLKDAKSCHTGAGKTTGWTVPISNLIQKKIIKIENCYSTTQNAMDLFTQSCVPGGMTERFNPLKLNPPRMCALCKNSQEPCASNDDYHGYNGAMKCLAETKADIAFVKHETITGVNKDDYKLLCPSDELKELDQYEECNWAVRPSDTIVVTPDSSSRTDIANTLKNNINLLRHYFKWDNVQELESTDKDYAELMGEGFKNTFEYYHNCQTDLRWCADGDEAMKKCEDIKLAFMAKRATNKLVCVKGKDHADCMRKIEQKKADFVVLDGGDLEIAMQNCKLTPILAESYGVETATYYTVAVVKADADFNINQLKGKKSCHTGIGKTSGWKSPISHLIEKGFIPATGDAIPVRVSKFFNGSCAPGANDPKYNKNADKTKNLCALCPENSKCKRDDTNIYYGYTGAFRCLVQGGGEVAFVKHTTVLESTDGNRTNTVDNWEVDLKSANYKLLCKNGSTAAVTEWRSCYWAKVPAHAMVIRKGEEKTLGHRLIRVFNNFDLSSTESKDLLFKSPGGKDLLFKDSTKTLIQITEPHNFLGKDYLEILKVFGDKTEVCHSSGASHQVISVMVVLFSVLYYMV